MVIPGLSTIAIKVKGPLFPTSGPFTREHSHEWLCRMGLELLGCGSAGRLVGRSLLDLDREALAVGIDRGERARAVGFRGGAVGVFGVFRGVLGEMRRERGNGLLALENGDLDVGSGAFPRAGVGA